MALARCILGKYLGVRCHLFSPPLDVPNFSARCLHVQRRERPLVAECGTLRGREMFRQIWPKMRIPRNSRDLLHAVKPRHGNDGFTYPPKDFFSLKIPTASAGFELANFDTKGQHATSRPPKPFCLWDNVENIGRAGQATDGNIIQRMSIAYWTPKTTNTFSEYVIMIAFPIQQWLHERTSPYV